MNRNQINILISTIMYAIGPLSNVVISLFAARYLGIESFGIYAIILSIYSLFFSLFYFGTSDAIVILGNQRNTDRSLFSAFFFLDITTALGMVISYKICCYYDIFKWFNIDIADFSVLIIPSLLVFPLKSSILGSLKLQKRIDLINKFYFFEAMSRVVVFIVVASWDLTVKSMLGYFLIQNSVGLIMLFYMGISNRVVGIQIPSVSVVKDVIKFSIPLFLSSLTKVGYRNFDNLILSKYLGSGFAGTYNLTMRILSPASLLSVPLNNLYQSDLVQSMKQKESTLKVFLSQSLRVGLFFMVFYVGVSNGILFYINDYIKVDYDVWVVTAVALLSTMPVVIWWSSSFFTFYNRKIPIYTNIILSVLSILVPIFVFSIFNPSLKLFAFSALTSYGLVWVYGLVYCLRKT